MLTEKQKQAAQMVFEWRYLSSDLTMLEIAAAVGVHRCTLWRWTKRRDFRKELQRHRKNADKRRYRVQDKLRANMEARAEAAFQKWENRVKECENRVQELTDLSGNKPTEQLIEAQKALSNALSADPLRGVVPGLKSGWLSFTDQR